MRSRKSGSRPRAFSASHAGAVRRSCQTIALPIGSPVARFQTIVVSRWLVMPIAGDVGRGEAGPGERLARRRELRAPDLARVVLDPAGLRVDLAELALRHGDDPAARVEDDRARARGALVEGEQVAGSWHACVVLTQ